MEIRDPVHQFIEISQLESGLLDLPPLQRLRAIRQLSTTYLVYPGATHTRFEHALGTMHLAGRALDAVVRNSDPALLDRASLGTDNIPAAKRIIRLAGLLHDVGHTPFSHTFEGLFRPVDGKAAGHEAMTMRILRTYPAIRDALGDDLETVLQVAVGPQYAPSEDPATNILTSLVTGILGVDRMDYLLRDCHYTGVTYGAFDVARILATIKLVDHPDRGFVLALTAGGQYVAEQMLLARWHMFHQVYFQEERRIFDHHLTEYCKDWLTQHFQAPYFPESIDAYLSIADHHILASMDESSSSHAKAIRDRTHLRLFRRFEPGRFDDTSFATLIRTLEASGIGELFADSATLRLIKSDDGDIWIETDDGLQGLSQLSHVVQAMGNPIKLRRLYCPKQYKFAFQQLLTTTLNTYADEGHDSHA